MGEILGIGLTHYPGLISPDEDRNFPLTRTLKSDRIPAEPKDPANWPEAMRRAYGDDQSNPQSRGAVEYEKEDDPPGPSPRRCMEVGAATVRALRDTPWRVALIASSSWSHAFLTRKNNLLWADMESDRARFEELEKADYDAWRRVSTNQIEAAGQQELLNWMCLAGAMQELDRKPEIIDYVETYVFNSDKCLAVFKP